MLQIVPTLPPAVGGVGDYAVVLARELAGTGWTTAFLTRHGGGALAAEFAVAALGPVGAFGDAFGVTLRRQLEELGAKTVVLHLSGYGFARWGLCFGLGAGICRWRRAKLSRRLVLVVHELYATGPIWRASFWTAAPQIAIARHLAAHADAIVTTSDATREILARWQRDLDVRVMPVFSTVGEAAAPLPTPLPVSPPAPLSPSARRPATPLPPPPSARRPAAPLPPSARPPAAAVFGGVRRRAAVYRALAGRNAASAAAAFAAAGIERIVDIGAPFPGRPDMAAGVRVDALGLASAAAVADALGNARYGLAHYPHHLVTKSTILAAYFAHGLVAVDLDDTGRLPRELAFGRELLDFPTFRSGGCDLDRVAAAGHAWYRGHCVAAVASLIAAMAGVDGQPARSEAAPAAPPPRGAPPGAPSEPRPAAAAAAAA